MRSSSELDLSQVTLWCKTTLAHTNPRYLGIDPTKLHCLAVGEGIHRYLSNIETSQ